jgi:hypothetical protein
MSLSQTYFVAASARQKLGKEAARSDHDLRLLVGHANLLDSLMLELADAEREQEAWFNQTVRKANRAEDEPKHIRWVDTIPEDAESDEDEDSYSDSDSEAEYDEDEVSVTPIHRVVSPSAKPRIVTTEIVFEDGDFDDSDDEEFEDDEYDAEHALVRVASQSPPELIIDDESDDETQQPPSPPQPTLEYSESGFFDAKAGSLVQSDKAFDQFFTERTAPLVASY